MARRVSARSSVGRSVCVGVLLLLFAPVLSAQPPANAGGDTARARMAPLRWLVGEWEGPATVTNSGRTFSLTQRESVQEAANGTVLLVQGRGSMTLPNGTERNVFQAAGLLTYEVDARKFTWISSGGTGHLGTTEAQVTGRGYIWKLVRPGGKRTRYTISQTANDEWREIGEETADGTNWTKTFEMTLKRKR